ncbi:MAG TPA: hypothetical protein VG755_06435 [Nannocystaceae bacterium]|nr:hypothetical protein [Nannocystaceae bacterium]
MKLAHRIAVALAGAVAGTTLGCLIELEHRLACGDGYVDPEAGEECDPGDEDSFKDACADGNLGGGTAICNPETCELEADEMVCAKCNDGVHVIGLEECDLVAPMNAECGMGGQPSCIDCMISYESCLPYCGDGDVDPAEECDPDPNDEAGLATTVSCDAEDESHLPRVQSAQGSAARFGSGETTCDASTCHWFRQSCSYCGNGTLEDTILPKDPYNPAVLSLAEWCEGEVYSKTALEAYYDGCSESQRPNVSCAKPGEPDACRGFIDHDDGELCCQLEDELYPGDDASLRCCWEYEHPGEQPWHMTGVNRVCN